MNNEPKIPNGVAARLSPRGHMRNDNFILPPFRNIRYFSFMKLMYLDIF
jgi:hypothetical protein